MPFTPFHFGPGMLVKSLAQRRFWLTSFLTTNVLIDVEVLYFMWRGEPPLHRFLHTYLGATFAGVIAGFGIFAVVLGCHRFLRRSQDSSHLAANTSRLHMLLYSVLSGLAGGWSHVLLDSFVHQDVQPFLPFSAGNHLAGALNLQLLYPGLVISGLIGVVIWLWVTKFVE